MTLPRGCRATVEDAAHDCGDSDRSRGGSHQHRGGARGRGARGGPGRGVCPRTCAASLGLDSPVLSDPDGTTARAYGVIGVSGFPSRWTFFIGTDGRILDIDKRVQVVTHGRDVVAKLSELGVARRA